MGKVLCICVCVCVYGNECMFNSLAESNVGLVYKFFCVCTSARRYYCAKTTRIEFDHKSDGHKQPSGKWSPVGVARTPHSLICLRTGHAYVTTFSANESFTHSKNNNHSLIIHSCIEQCQSAGHRLPVAIGYKNNL